MLCMYVCIYVLYFYMYMLESTCVCVGWNLISCHTYRHTNTAGHIHTHKHTYSHAHEYKKRSIILAQPWWLPNIFFLASISDAPSMCSLAARGTPCRSWTEGGLEAKDEKDLVKRWAVVRLVVSCDRNPEVLAKQCVFAALWKRCTMNVKIWGGNAVTPHKSWIYTRS